ncbi:hypothetical protein CHS0354_011489 [Potamilus streckersoni]|uniref:Uncharacterized protein n=1 Tax=Potamilus streckersoni TaxID=2493646 RepID=A0AAE0SKX5_9BIVA|nr:hypothetical protein CHS0354_011489 [Potamilus streckersoni]
MQSLHPSDHDEKEQGIHYPVSIMRKTTIFFVLEALILIQLTAARKEHVICQDILQLPRSIESDERKGYDADILEEIRIRPNLTTYSCTAELKLQHPLQETVNDPNYIFTARTMHNSRQSKTRIHTDETSIVGNNMVANIPGRTDKRIASALRVKNAPLQKGNKFHRFVTKDTHTNKGRNIRRDVQFSELRRRLDDKYRRLSTDDYRRLFTDRKHLRDKKINILLSDTRRDETTINYRRRQHFSRSDGRQNISRQKYCTLARYTERRQEDLKDNNFGLNLQSGFNVVRNVARMELHRKNPVTRGLTDGDKMNRIIGETRNVARNNENFLRTRRSVDSMREGEVMGTKARRVDRGNLTKSCSKKIIRNNGYHRGFGNGKEHMSNNDGRATNLYRHYTRIQCDIKENNIRDDRGKDLSVSTRSRRTTEDNKMDREARERRAVKSSIREQHEKLHFLVGTRDSDENGHCGSSSVRCIETKAISVRIKQGERRMVDIKQDHQRNVILHSRRDDKNTRVQKYGHSSYIRRGNYYEQRTDTIDMIGINRARSHEREEHIEDIARALTVTRGRLSIKSDQRSSSERRDVISDKRFQPDVARLTIRRISIRQMIGRSLRSNEDVLATERANVEQRVKKGAIRWMYITQQSEVARRSLQHGKYERQEMFVSSSKNSLRKIRKRKSDVTVFREKRQDNTIITEKETSSPVSARLKVNIRLMKLSLSSRRENQIGLAKVRCGRILPKTERKGNNLEWSRSNNMKPASVRNDKHFPWTLQEQHPIWNDVISVTRALLLGAAGLLGTQMFAKEKLF